MSNEEIAVITSTSLLRQTNHQLEGVIQEPWQMHHPRRFTGYLSSNLPDTHMKENVKDFYKSQDRQIHAFEKLYNEVCISSVNGNTAESDDVSTRSVRLNTILSQTTFAANLLILIGKCVAATLSGSLSIIAALLDSVVDLISGGVMWWAAYAMAKRNRYIYPQGRSRLEPVAIIILAVIMGVVSIQIIKEGVVLIVQMSTQGKTAPTVDDSTIIITCVIVFVKLTLWIVCWKFGTSSSSEALAQDSRNDVLSNTIAVVFSSLSSRIGVDGLKYLDPIGAIIIGLYILRSWWKTGMEHTQNVTGYTADPRFLQRITFIALNHHMCIEKIDIVRAFHMGVNFQVEVDVVLPAQISLKEAHDIGESLQVKLERLEEVERAFVHLHYEFSHDLNSEHRMV